MTTKEPRDNFKGGAWLIADMSLNIWALSIVKWLGGDYPAYQIVFIRALTGLVLLTPLIWVRRSAFRQIDNPGVHTLRVVLSVITLNASFFAISRVPFAVFTAIGFTRPIVTMVLATVILSERIGPRRWVAAVVALVGVLLAANPRDVPWTLGLGALVLVVITGSGAIIATRHLRAAPPIVMMTFYTLGLSACVAPFALVSWVEVKPSHILPLLFVGVFSQCAQLCFLRAHFHGEAGYLSVLSYLSLVISVAVGFLVFNETPSLEFWLGASLVIGAAFWLVLREWRNKPAG